MRAVLNPVREELTGLLQDIVRRAAQAGRDVRALSHAGQGPGLLAPGGCPPTDPSERALLDVHRTELARLLRDAARAALAALDEPGDSAVSRAALRDGLREAQRCAQADGLRFALPVTELVRACLRAEGAHGPRWAAELALGSLRLEECIEGRELLAAGLSAGGDELGASVVLAATLLSLRRIGDAIPGRRRALITGLSAAQARAGERGPAGQLTRLAERLEDPQEA